MAGVAHGSGEPHPEGTLYASVKRWVHCKHCVEERPEGVSPAEYAALSVGVSWHGLLVWCRRHQVPVIYAPYGDMPVIFQQICTTPCAECGEVDCKGHKKEGRPPD